MGFFIARNKLNGIKTMELLKKLKIKPDQASYSVKSMGGEVAGVQTASGAYRQRANLRNVHKIANVSWTRDAETINKILRFYRVMTDLAGQYFEIDLIIGEAKCITHKARFIPDSWSFDGVQGHAYTVSAQLEVIPHKYDSAYEEAIVDMLTAFDSMKEAKQVINHLEKLVNHDIPEAYEPTK